MFNWSHSDPLGILSECHSRIEMFLRSLERVALVIVRLLAGRLPAFHDAGRVVGHTDADLMSAKCDE
jgi:hypothetical protein